MEPEFHFTYFLFDWVKPWPGNGIIIQFCLLGALCLLIMLGVLYRVSARARAVDPASDRAPPPALTDSGHENVMPDPTLCGWGRGRGAA